MAKLNALRLLEKADAALVARNRALWAAVPWTDPETGMGKRRDLCGLLVRDASRITLRPSGRPVRSNDKRIRLTTVERRRKAHVMPAIEWRHGH
jgi:hypothetical protein